MQQRNQSRPATVSAALASSTRRALSVDVLRGLVMFTMIFVNDIAGGRGLPAWLKHFHNDRQHPSGMTFVDLVFPAFLFIVGMSIPLAVEGRRAKGEPCLKIYGHVILRTLGLLAIGVLMVNGENEATGWREGLWNTLMFCGVILAFHSVQLTKPAARYISYSIRVAGAALLIFLAWRFRNSRGGSLEHSWWGILGLIGWAYFVATTLYLLLRREHLSALAAAPALLMCLYFADHAGAFRHFVIPLGSYTLHPTSWVNFGEALGSHASITMAGVVLGALLLPTSLLRSHSERLRLAGILAIIAALAAVLLEKTYGISKNAATPSWCLWSIAITTAVWVALYLVIDVAGMRRWATIPLAWAGASALLIYILSELWSSAGPLVNWPWYDHLGARYPSVIGHGLLTAAVITLLGGALGRIGFRLRL